MKIIDECMTQWVSWNALPIVGSEGFQNQESTMNTTKTLFMFLEYFDTIDPGSLKYSGTMGFSTWF